MQYISTYYTGGGESGQIEPNSRASLHGAVEVQMLIDVDRYADHRHRMIGCFLRAHQTAPRTDHDVRARLPRQLIVIELPQHVVLREEGERFQKHGLPFAGEHFALEVRAHREEYRTSRGVRDERGQLRGQWFRIDDLKSADGNDVRR
uniref:Uncharacterized protein n=1 Tax=Anopheles dirus TaxID=7168 RepID=A0A182NJS6_9DIPT